MPSHVKHPDGADISRGFLTVHRRPIRDLPNRASTADGWQVISTDVREASSDMSDLDANVRRARTSEVLLIGSKGVVTMR